MRILSMLLALVMLLSFAACSQTPADPADSTDGAGDAAGETTPAETTEDPLNDNLPEVTYDGAEFIIWGDPGWEGRWYEPSEDVEIEGDIVMEAVVSRNTTVSERFDVTLAYDLPATPGWRDMGAIRQSILGGDTYDLFTGVTLYTVPLSLYGCFINLYNQNHLDFDKPWWAVNIINNLNIGTRYLMASGDFEFPSNTRANLIYFNGNMVEDYQLGNMYDLVSSGDWTFDKMVELGQKVADDVNNDGIYDEQDNYGVCGGWDGWGNQTSTSGYRFIDTNEDGELFLTGLNDTLLAVCERIYPMTHGANWYYSSYTQGGPHNEAMANQMFFNDQILFMLAGVGSTGGQDFREFGAYGLLPVPKFTDDQEEYGANVSAYVGGIPATANDYETSCIIYSALQAESYKQIRPAYFETALSYKYLNDPKAMDTINLIFENVHCGFAYNYAQCGLGVNLCLIASTQENPASYFESQQASLEKVLADLVAQIEALPE